ncbi:uncharacterized protein LOC128195217 isoform X2 [Vigna angularis]|uniref:uncharacterized protein LOC128195217 isoform X2 n=1 Tax=Phaseolus angularis TaxID=3914 RepID=UPI0022B3A5B6|nr:uncharacterized protein LOC128195217 isoform X2 [Vigna angularis]
MMMQASSDAKESSDYNAGAPASTVLYARLNSGELVLRLGANHPAGDMTLLETGEPVYSPEGPLLTEDLIKETEEFVLRTRRFPLASSRHSLGFAGSMKVSSGPAGWCSLEW